MLNKLALFANLVRPPDDRVEIILEPDRSSGEALWIAACVLGILTLVSIVAAIKTMALKRESGRLKTRIIAGVILLALTIAACVAAHKSADQVRQSRYIEFPGVKRSSPPRPRTSSSSAPSINPSDASKNETITNDDFEKLSEIDKIQEKSRYAQ